VFDRHNSKKKVSSRFGFIRYQIVQKQLNDWTKVDMILTIE
jgi:hypothetical protein